MKALLEELAERGVRLWVEGAQLRYRGPRKELTPELLARLKEKKPHIVTLLSKSAANGNSAAERAARLKEIREREEEKQERDAKEADLSTDPVVFLRLGIGSDWPDNQYATPREYAEMCADYDKKVLACMSRLGALR
jgi:hypothetical protein